MATKKMVKTMSENDLADTPLHQAPAPRRRLGMKDHRAARLSLARLIRLRYSGVLSTELFRDLVYGMSLLLQFFKHASDLEIERRLDEIERLLAEEKEGRRL